MTNDLFSALAHPVRRRIVERLALGSTTVGVATSHLGLSKPTISRHLGVLEESGLVRRRVSGREHHLTLDVEALSVPYEWLSQQRDIWERMFDAVEDQLRSSGVTRD